MMTKTLGRSTAACAGPLARRLHVPNTRRFLKSLRIVTPRTVAIRLGNGLPKVRVPSAETAAFANADSHHASSAATIAVLLAVGWCSQHVRIPQPQPPLPAAVRPAPHATLNAKPRALPLAAISLSGPQQQPAQPTPFGDALAYVQYKVLQALTLPAWGKVLMVVAVALPILAAGSALLCKLTGERPAAALLRCYQILNNVPGTDIASEGDPRAALVLNVVYGVGLLTFAVVIGVLGDDIASAVEAARLGNSPVPERNHTVILGHNRQLVEVVRQVASVRADRGSSAFPGPLVVLSPLERGELEAELAAQLGGAAAAGVVARQGSPMQLLDLQRVAAGQARTVILLAPGGEGQGGADGSAAEGDGAEAGGGHALSAEAQQAVTLAALQHLRTSAAYRPASGAQPGPQTVVVQHDAALELVSAAAAAAGAPGEAAAAAPRELVAVSYLNSLARLQAQCAAQPGLAAVLSSVMQQRAGAPEFYVQRVPELSGLTYGEARRCFPRAVLCGIYDPAGPAAAAASSAAPTSPESRLDFEATAVVLNPPDGTVLLERHSLILLADTANDLRPKGQSQQAGDGAVDGAAAAAAASGRSAAGRARKANALAGGGAEVCGRAAAGRRAERGAAAQRVVVLAFDGRAPAELLEALSDYCPPGSKAVVVAAEGSEAAREGRRCRKQHSLRVRTVAADPRVIQSLREAGVEKADAVVLSGLEGVPTQQADAQALATLLQLQALALPHAARAPPPPPSPEASAAKPAHQDRSETAKPLNLVCAVIDPRVREVMAGLEVLQPGAAGGPRGVAVDAINPDEMLAGVLTQVAAEPRLAGLFHQLSSSEGVEIYMRTPAALDLPYDQPLTWQQVQDESRRRGVTVIGLLRDAAGSASGQGGAAASRLQLGVPLPVDRPAGGRSWSQPAGSPLTLGPGDKLVVLAQEAQEA